ncbi:unnamed protein product [Sympodiomycopsis kandeliae]
MNASDDGEISSSPYPSKRIKTSSSQRHPRTSLLVQKLAQRKEGSMNGVLPASPSTFAPQSTADASPSRPRPRPRPLSANRNIAVPVEMPPTPPSTRSPEESPSRSALNSEQRHSPQVSPTPNGDKQPNRRKRMPATHPANIDGANPSSPAVTLDHSIDNDSLQDSSLSMSGDSSSSSVRRSGRSTKPFDPKGLPPVLAPSVHSSHQRSERSDERNTEARTGRSEQPTATTTSSTARRSRKRKSPQISSNAPSDQQDLQSSDPPSRRRGRTSLSQPLLTPPPSSAPTFLGPSHPVRERANSTQPYSTPQQHRGRIQDVTKRRIAVTTVTKRGVWRAGSILGTRPDPLFDKTPIVLQPESPTEDPILLRPTPKELEEERRLREQQLQRLLETEAETASDDTFAGVRARNQAGGDETGTSQMLVAGLSSGPNASQRGPHPLRLERSESFAESGIDDIPEEEEEDDHDMLRQILKTGNTDGNDVQGSDHVDAIAQEDGVALNLSTIDREGVDFGLDGDDDAGVEERVTFDASAGAEYSDDDYEDAPQAYQDAEQEDSQPPTENDADTSMSRVEEADERDHDPSEEEHIRDDGANSQASEDLQDTSAFEYEDESQEVDEVGEAPEDQLQETSGSQGVFLENQDSQSDNSQYRSSSRRSLSSSRSMRDASDPLAESASFLYEEQMRSHSRGDAEDESYDSGYILRARREEEEAEDAEEAEEAEQSLHSSPFKQEDDHQSDYEILKNAHHEEEQDGEDLDEDRSDSDHEDEMSEAAEDENVKITQQSPSRLDSTAATPNRLVVSPDERSYSRSIRADSLLDRLYEDSARHISPFAYRASVPHLNTPSARLGDQLAQLRIQSSGQIPTSSPTRAESTHRESPSRRYSTLHRNSPRSHPYPDASRADSARAGSPSRSYSILTGDSTRLAMHSLTRDSSIVEILSTDAEAAARAAALLRVHHDWIHEGHLVTEDGEADLTSGYRGDVLRGESYLSGLDAELPGLLRAAEARLASQAEAASTEHPQIHEAFTPRQRSATPRQSHQSVQPTPRAPGAYTFSPAGSPYNKADDQMRTTPTHAGATEPQMEVSSLRQEATQDPATFSRTAWAALDGVFRKQVREKAQGDQLYSRPRTSEKRQVVLHLDQEEVIREFLEMNHLTYTDLSARWSHENLLKSVRALQRKFFQRLERHRPGCLTSEEALIAGESINGSEEGSIRQPSVTFTDDDRDTGSLISRSASPYVQGMNRPASPQISTPLVSKEKRMRRLDVYIPSPTREDTNTVSPAARAEEVMRQVESPQTPSQTQTQIQRAVQETTPTGRSSAGLFDFVGKSGSALKKRLSSVFAGRGESEPLETAGSDVEGTSVPEENARMPSSPLGNVDFEGIPSPRQIDTVLEPGAACFGREDANSSNATTVLSSHGDQNEAGADETWSPDNSRNASIDNVQPRRSPSDHLYPVLPVQTSTSITSVTDDVSFTLRSRLHMRREQTDAASRLASKLELQRYRDESLEMRNRFHASSTEESPPVVELPLQRPPTSTTTKSTGRVSKPRKSLLLDKLRDRQDDSVDLSSSSMGKRKTSPTATTIGNISLNGRLRSEKLAHQRMKRRQKNAADQSMSMESDSVLA